MHSPTAPRFQWRALTSVLMTLGFIMIALSGVMLFLSPPGRVANWTNWTLLGLRKSDWGALHLWFGALFLTMTTVHVFFNWGPLMSYLKNRATRTLGFRAEWAVAAAICVVVFGGTRAGIPPFSSLLAWNESFKESWERPAERAPIPHAELLTLAALAQKGGVDLTAATARLTAKGLTGFTAETVVRDLAAHANLSAQQIYDIILAAPKDSASGGHTEGKAGGGLGWKTLAQFCADEGIDPAVARGRLSAKGFKIDETQTLRELAASLGQKPYELVELIRGAPRP
jgi:hypothetical protein